MVSTRRQSALKLRTEIAGSRTSVRATWRGKKKKKKRKRERADNGERKVRKIEETAAGGIDVDHFYIRSTAGKSNENLPGRMKREIITLAGRFFILPLCAALDCT